MSDFQKPFVWVGGMNPKRFKEYRKDGWPLCPRCGEDELASHLALLWDGREEPHRPTVLECLRNGFVCMACGWEDDRDYPVE